MRLTLRLTLALLLLSIRATYGQTLTLNPSAIASGGSVTVTVSGAPSNIDSWVGLYKSGTTGIGQYLDWFYIGSATKTLPPLPKASNTLVFVVANIGAYQFVLHSVGSYSPLVYSTILNVTQVGAITYTAGTSNSVTCTFLPTEVNCTGPNGSSQKTVYPYPITIPGTVGSFGLSSNTITWSYKPAAVAGKTDWMVVANGVKQSGTF